MSSDRSMPRPRSISGASSSRMRPVPVPRSSRVRNGRSQQQLADFVFDRLIGGVQAADAVPLGGMAAEIVLGRLDARGAQRRRAARGRAPRSDRPGRARRPSRRTTARRRRARRGGKMPTSLRGTARPARHPPSSLRWREMRGCDWRRISVSSDTVSSASARRTRMRSRVSSPTALSVALRSSKAIAGARHRRQSYQVVPSGTSEDRHKDIFMQAIDCGSSQGGFRGCI